MSQQAVIDGIYDKLAGDTGPGGVATLAGGRIHEGQAQQDAPMPLVIFTIVDDPTQTTFEKDHFRAEVQFDVYGDRRNGSEPVRAIADRIFELFHRQAITISGLVGGQGWIMDRGQLNYEEDAARIMTRCRVWAFES